MDNQVSDLLGRAMQRIAREDFDKAEKAMVTEFHEGMDRIVAQAKAMIAAAYSGDAGDETN